LATRLDAAAQEVARLTSNLLMESVDLAAVAANVAELLAPRTERTGVRLHIDQGVMPPAVVADRALLRQALLNLCSYALDQACRGGEVAVTWVQAERAAGLELAACAATLDAAIESAAAPARREGVGVSVAQKLIEAMGGQTMLEETGSDWRCTLLLPAAPRDTVLVVDDNADLTALFQRYAAGHPLNVVGANSGSQALALAGELHPQMIILDLMLSQMDGWEILQRLRASPATQDTPIIICSVLNEQELAFSLGASDYVTKPISQTTLIDVLQRWLEKPPPHG
jgi:CheY-like chemotaxis protein